MSIFFSRECPKNSLDEKDCQNGIQQSFSLTFNPYSYLSIYRYAFLFVSEVTTFLKSYLGNETYNTRETYGEECEEGDILIFGGKLASNEAHCGICTGGNTDISSELPAL